MPGTTDGFKDDLAAIIAVSSDAAGACWQAVETRVGKHHAKGVLERAD